MKKRSINIQVLYDLVIQREKVDPWNLVEVSEGLYRSVKTVGIQNTLVHYTDKTGEFITQEGTDIPVEMRAMAAFVMTLFYRWGDSNSGRLEQHFGLPISIHIIFGDTKIFKNNNAGIACINVMEVIDAYLDRK